MNVRFFVPALDLALGGYNAATSRTLCKSIERTVGSKVTPREFASRSAFQIPFECARFRLGSKCDGNFDLPRRVFGCEDTCSLVVLS